MLKALAQRCESPCSVPNVDLLIVAEASSSTVRRRSFWRLVAASFQSGHHNATETFWRCEALDGLAIGRDYGDLQVNLVMGPLVIMSSPGPRPFDSQHPMPTFFRRGGGG
eukprot:8262284-Pyramimonas_sp.AAC.1